MIKQVQVIKPWYRFYFWLHYESTLDSVRLRYSFSSVPEVPSSKVIPPKFTIEMIKQIQVIYPYMGFTFSYNYIISLH